LAADIKEAYPGTGVRLVEGAGGVFEVSVDEKLIFSKIEIGRHPAPDEILNFLKKAND
jgi:selT/selW/selH-like putative selenoprotein